MKRIVPLLLVALSIAACSPTARPGGNPAPGPNMSSPAPRAPSIQDTALPAALPQPQWFREEFDQGMPSHWFPTPGWQSGADSVLTTLPVEAVRIPGQWADLKIEVRLRRDRQGWSSIGFRNKGGSYYQLSFNEELLILSRRLSSQQSGQTLVAREVENGAGWYTLTIQAVGGQITVWWDGLLEIDTRDEDPLAAGDIFIDNTDNSLLELDYMAIQEPGSARTAGSGASGNQPAADSGTGGNSSAPAGSAGFDLFISRHTIDDRGAMWITIDNQGPDRFTGSLTLGCSMWYQTPSGGTYYIYGEPLTTSALDMQAGQSVDIETSCGVDPKYGVHYGGEAQFTGVPGDTNPANDYYRYD